MRRWDPLDAGIEAEQSVWKAGTLEKGRTLLSGLLCRSLSTFSAAGEAILAPSISYAHNLSHARLWYKRPLSVLHWRV